MLHLIILLQLLSCIVPTLSISCIASRSICHVSLLTANLFPLHNDYNLTCIILHIQRSLPRYLPGLKETTTLEMPFPTKAGTVSPVAVRSHTPNAYDFPTPAGQTFHVTKRDQGLMSPAQSSFSFPDEDEPHAVTTPQHAMEEKGITRHIDRGSPGDAAFSSTNVATPQLQELRKKKSQFYTEVFSYREPNLTPKERVYKDSMVTAEVKTNVIVRLG